MPCDLYYSNICDTPQFFPGQGIRTSRRKFFRGRIKLARRDSASDVCKRCLNILNCAYDTLFYYFQNAKAGAMAPFKTAISSSIVDGYLEPSTSTLNTFSQKYLQYRACESVIESIDDILEKTKQSMGILIELLRSQHQIMNTICRYYHVEADVHSLEWRFVSLVQTQTKLGVGLRRKTEMAISKTNELLKQDFLPSMRQKLAELEHQILENFGNKATGRSFKLAIHSLYPTLICTASQDLGSKEYSPNNLLMYLDSSPDQALQSFGRILRLDEVWDSRFLDAADMNRNWGCGDSYEDMTWYVSAEIAIGLGIDMCR